MASQGTPDAGLALIAQRVFGTSAQYQLLAYTNDQDSLSASSVSADLTQPTEANGYAPIVLGGTWSFTDGVATYVHDGSSSDDGQGNPCWYASGTWSDAVTGVAMVDVNTGTLQHFMDLRDGTGDSTTFVAAAGKKLAVAISNLTSP